MKKSNKPHHTNPNYASLFPATALRLNHGLWNEATPDESDDSRGDFRLLMVPLDGSPHAEHALPHALAIARRSGATIRLVHVFTRTTHVEPLQMATTFEVNERRKRDKQDYLRDIASRIFRADDVKLETVVIDSDDTVDALFQATVGADLVVMASRRRSLFLRLWSRSAADGLRKHLRLPLLLVRGYSSPVDLTADPFPRHILVPLDGTSAAERVLEPTLALGRLDGSALTLLNVQNDEWPSNGFQHTSPIGYLGWVAREVKDCLPIVSAHVMSTDERVVPAILSFTKGRHVDLIAMTTQSDGGLSRLLRGSTVDELIRRTHAPILILANEPQKKRVGVTTVA